MRFRSHYALSPPPTTAEDSSKVIFLVVFARAIRRSISFFRWCYFGMFILFKVRRRRSSTLCVIMMIESELSDLIAFFYPPVFLLQLSNAYLTPVARQYVYCLSTTLYIHWFSQWHIQKIYYYLIVHTLISQRISKYCTWETAKKSRHLSLVLVSHSLLPLLTCIMQSAFLS